MEVDPVSTFLIGRCLKEKAGFESHRETGPERKGNFSYRVQGGPSRKQGRDGRPQGGGVQGLAALAEKIALKFAVVVAIHIIWMEFALISCIGLSLMMDMKGFRLGKTELTTLAKATEDWRPITGKYEKMQALKKMERAGLIESRRTPGKVVDTLQQGRRLIDIAPFIPKYHILGEPIVLPLTALIKASHPQKRPEKVGVGFSTEYRITDLGKQIANIYQQAKESGKSVRWDRVKLARK